MVVLACHSDNALCLINEVSPCRDGLVVGRMTACGQANHLRM